VGAKDAVGTAADDATHSHLLGYAGTCALESWTQRAALAARARCAFLFAPSHPFGINLCAQLRARPELKKRSWQTPTWRGVASLQEYFQAQIVSARERERGGERERLRGHEFAGARHGTARTSLRFRILRASRAHGRTHWLLPIVRGGLCKRASKPSGRAGKRASKPSGRAGGHNCLGERGMASVCDVREGTRCPRTRLRLPAGGSAESPKAPPPRELRMRPRSNEPPRARRREPRHAEQHETRPRANPISHFFFPSECVFTPFRHHGTHNTGHKTQHVQRACGSVPPDSSTWQPD